MIYTAITGGYDPPRTDVKCFGKYDKFKDEVRNAKIYKVLSHYFIKDEYCIWIDGNLTLKKPEQEYYKLLREKDIAVFRHTERTNIYQEAQVCMNWKKDDKKTIADQVARYEKSFKEENLGMCFLIIRRQTPKIKRLNEKWWAEICLGSRRDQISFPYVFRDVSYIDINDKVNNEYFKRNGHKA